MFALPYEFQYNHKKYTYTTQPSSLKSIYTINSTKKKTNNKDQCFIPNTRYPPLTKTYCASILNLKFIYRANYLNNQQSQWNFVQA